MIVDDVAIPIGTYRVRARGSAGGHNGLKSVQHALGTMEYGRLRVGILPSDERRQVGDLADFVLAPFGKDEREEILALLPDLTRIAELWLREGIEVAMNTFNR